MADDSDLEKSEQPSETKIRKAREEGQIPRSRELTSMSMLMAGMAVFWIVGPSMGSNLIKMMQQGMTIAYRTDDEKQMLLNLFTLLKSGFWTVFPILLVLVIVALIAPIAIGGLLFSSKSLQPDINRLNPISGMGKIFSSRMLAELLKGLLKVALIACVTGIFLMINFPAMLTLSRTYFTSALGESMRLIILCGLLVILSLIPMVSFDIFYQIWSNLKKLKMSKQEVKDEFKEQEGDPQLKARVRQMQRSLARRRMMDDVAKANVIVTNPTHYAVALQYDEKTMSAPKVLAKGVDLIALRIRELAEEHKIPQLEAPPLARALYRHSEIGQTIPTELYSAVAQVLVWVYQLKRWSKQGGVAPIRPKNILVPKSLDPAAKKGGNSSNGQA